MDFWKIKGKLLNPSFHVLEMYNMYVNLLFQSQQYSFKKRKYYLIEIWDGRIYCTSLNVEMMDSNVFHWFFFHKSLYLQQTISESIFEIYTPFLYSKHRSYQLQDFFFIWSLYYIEVIIDDIGLCESYCLVTSTSR